MEHNESTQWTPAQLAYMAMVVHIPIIVVSNSIILITVVLLRNTITMDSCAIGFLAGADLLIGLVCVPFLMASVLDHGGFHQPSAHHATLCQKVPTNFTFALSQSMLMLLNIDRLLAINWPFWYIANVTNINIVLSALALFLMDVGIYIILFGYVLLNNENVPSGNIETSCLSIYYGKLAISLVCTAKVAFELTKSVKYIRGSIDKHQLRAMKSKSKVTVALTTLYVILWLPKLVEHTIHEGEVREVTVTHAITDHILLLNSSVNVFVYSLSRETYKISCKFILTNRPCEWKHLPKIVATSSRCSRCSTSTRYSTSARTSIRPTPCSSPQSLTPDLRRLTPDLHTMIARLHDCEK